MQKIAFNMSTDIVKGRKPFDDLIEWEKKKKKFKEKLLRHFK